MFNLTEEQIKAEIELGKKFDKIKEIKKWFDNFYTHHEQKYRRLHTLNLLCDDGTLPIEKLTQLYEVAELKRREIQSLEQGGDSNGVIY